MIIDLSQCFPEPPNGGARGPLPKQAQFMQSILDAQGSKFNAYVGGLGSGKTIIGCISLLSLALMYPGDYLIARQFMPQLKDTTLKTFLEVCPTELIHEHRVADGIVRIKAAGGKLSNVLFRQLEEADKLKSLNLSGFLIDEASQVSEAAFMLLQGRLRGPGLRKGFLTTNPNGHDWIYTWFVKQDHIVDVEINNKVVKAETIKKQYRLFKAPSTENVHLPSGYVESMMATWSPERIKREIEGSFDAFEGMVYHEFRRDTHVIQPFVIPEGWTRVMGMDHGFRNPAAIVWGAIDFDENIYIYREFYEREWLIEEICKGNAKKNKPGIQQLCKGEKIEQARIDPSTRAVRGIAGQSDWDIYAENLPNDFPLLPANNEKTAGIDRVKSYLKIQQSNNKPRMFIFSTCNNLVDEFSKYRYAELATGQIGKTNEKEEPMKVNDHALDALRYLVMSRPEPPKLEQTTWAKQNANTLAGRIAEDFAQAKKGKSTMDPFGDY